MSTATRLVDVENRTALIVVPPGVDPDPREGFVGCIAQGWDGDAGNGHPVWWYKISDSQWGDKIAAPAGLQGTVGPTGPAGSMAPHVPGAQYAQGTSTVVVRRTLWQCVANHTATVNGDGVRSAFEVDAVAGLWAPVNALPVESFHPYLAGAAQAVAAGATPTHVYARQTGTGVVTRFRFSCVAAAGNVAVGVQRGTGGGDSTPGDVLAWFSGFVPAVATSDSQPPQEIAVPGGVVVYAGDFLVFSADDPTATFLTVGATGPAAAASLLAGVSYVSRGDATPSADATVLSPATVRAPLVVGRP